jgi:lipopolysaccharide export system protein LptA
MKQRIIPVLVLLAMMASPWLLQAQESRTDWRGAGERKPIQVVSDRLDAYQEKNLVEFSGHVVATQGERVIRCDTLQLFFKKKTEKASQGAESGERASKTGDIDRIEAKGNVTVTEKARIVTGDLAVFTPGEQKIVMTGSPVLKEGNNVITGSRVVVLLDENRGFVEGSAGKRVSATVYPEESKENKK